jgi:hypothetical protein
MRNLALISARGPTVGGMVRRGVSSRPWSGMWSACERREMGSWDVDVHEEGEGREMGASGVASLVKYWMLDAGTYSLT